MLKRDGNKVKNQQRHYYRLAYPYIRGKVPTIPCGLCGRPSSSVVHMPNMSIELTWLGEGVLPRAPGRATRQERRWEYKQAA